MFGSEPRKKWRCCLCGDFIIYWEGAMWDTGQISEIIFEQNEQWALDGDEEGETAGDASELEKTDFKCPWIWRRIYRGIVVAPSAEDSFKCHLTGVGLRELDEDAGANSLRVPKDSSRSIFLECQMFLPPAFEEVTPMLDKTGNPLAYSFTPTKACGYPMHERCWNLMTHMLDADLIKAHLWTFVNAVLDNKPNVHSVMLREYGLKTEQGKEFPSGLWLQQTTPKRLYSDEKKMKCIDTLCVLEDPLRPPELQSFLKSRLSRCKKKAQKAHLFEKSKDPKLRPRVRPESRHRMKLRRTNPEEDLLPPELIMMILDELPQCIDMHFLACAFPSWPRMVPQGYWRWRCRNEPMMRHEELPDTGDFDWRSFYLGICRRALTSHGMRNRYRICGILERTKNHFLSRLEKEGKLEAQ